MGKSMCSATVMFQKRRTRVRYPIHHHCLLCSSKRTSKIRRSIQSNLETKIEEEEEEKADSGRISSPNEESSSVSNTKSEEHT